MIAFVEGIIKVIRKESLLVDVHGLGLEVFVARPESYRQMSEIFLYTYYQVHEDLRILYGFETEAEYDLFCKLIQVKGIGCRSAMNIFRAASPAQIIAAIENEDVKALKKLPGIGPKSASQIIFDLRGKITPIVKEETIASSGNSDWDECALALESLGYKPAQINAIRPEILQDESLQDVQAMLKKSLALMLKAKGA